MKLIFRHLSCLAVTLTASIMMHAQPAFTDQSLSPRERAEDLVSRLTLEEKVALMIYNSAAGDMIV